LFVVNVRTIVLHVKQKPTFVYLAALVIMGSLPTFAALSNEISVKPETSGGTADKDETAFAVLALVAGDAR